MQANKNARPAETPGRASSSHLHYTAIAPSGQDVFADVKHLLTMPQVAEAYGYRANRSSFIPCPFHREDTPSCKLYPNSWHCFGCGAGGSVIDFAAGLFGLSPLDAVRRLNDDFNLGLPLDRPATPAARQQIQQRQHVAAVYHDFETWRECTMFSLCDAHRLGILALQQEPDKLTDAEALAIRWLEALDYWESELESSDLGRQMAVFRERKEVAALCGRILSAMQTRSNVA